MTYLDGGHISPDELWCNYHGESHPKWKAVSEWTGEKATFYTKAAAMFWVWLIDERQRSKQMRGVE